MPSERITARVEKLLDEVDQAVGQGDWEVVLDLCTTVLRLDPKNVDAATYENLAKNAIADRDLSIPAVTEIKRDSPTPVDQRDQPSSSNLSKPINQSREPGTSWDGINAGTPGYRERDYREAPLASRSDRLGAAAIDLIIPVVAVGGGVLLNLWPFSVIAAVIVVVVQIGALAELGKTIGKVSVGIVVVDYESRTAVSAPTLLGTRSFVPTLLSIVTAGVFGLADNLAILREDRRCLHDHMADTIVVKDEWVRRSYGR